MLSIWDSIPVNERGEVIRKALRDYANQSDDDPNLREIRKIEIELQNLQNGFGQSGENLANLTKIWQMESQRPDPSGWLPNPLRIQEGNFHHLAK